ncbi:MAG: hypothetical protein VZR73_06750 [Acutalibacteraceae bacterium]|nr:hypothetical protein [Acutalibacteraceae bacterium]
MRIITKTITIPIEGNSMTFRIKKLDAFSGAYLLRLLSKAPDESDTLSSLFLSLPRDDLRMMMTICLNHAEVLLPAGYISVMTGDDWSWPELEYDTSTCLKLMLEVTVWTLTGFFSEGGSDSRSAEESTSK